MDEAASHPTSIRSLNLSGLPASVSWLPGDTVPAAPDISVAICHMSGDPIPLYMPALAEPGVGVHLDGHMWVEGELVQPFSLSQYACGSSVLVPANMPSSWLFHGDGTNLNFFLSPSLLPDVAGQVYDSDPARVEMIPAINLDDPLIYQIGLAALAVRGGRGPGDSLFLASLAQTLAIHIFRHYVSAPASPPELDGRLPAPILKCVLEYIAHSPEGDLSLRNLADLAHLSPYHFARLFKQSTGQTVHQYVIGQRLQVGYQLLLHGDLPLAEISARTGFADQSHFVRQFKHLFGVTPGTLRKHRKNLQADAQESSI